MRGKAVEIAAPLAYLASDESSYTTGAIHLIDGDWSNWPNPKECFMQLLRDNPCIGMERIFPCIGLTVADHAKETGAARPAIP